MLAVLGPVSLARAHGEPAAAHSIVASDSQGIEIVRLTEGLAVRTDGGFRFVCPAAWGDDVLAAAQSIPGGPGIVGAASGLFVVDRNGVVSPHPDPAAAGSIVALAASSRALFALQSADDGQRVLQVDAERVRVLWQSDRRWSDLVASRDAIHVVRLEGGDVHVARLSVDGLLLAEETATPNDVVSAARAVWAGDTLYVVALLPSLDYVLARIDDGAWTPVQGARLIAGPIELESGERYVALDGQLSRFDQERVEPLDATDFVTCLRTHMGTSYACSNGGLKAIGTDGIGGSLFELDEVVEPELTSLSSERRELCSLQWQRYVVDLLAVGIDVTADDVRTDAGASEREMQDAGAVTHMADASREDPSQPAGCVAVGGAASLDGAAWIALVLALQRAARGRAGNRSVCSRHAAWLRSRA